MNDAQGMIGRNRLDCSCSPVHGAAADTAKPLRHSISPVRHFLVLLLSLAWLPSGRAADTEYRIEVEGVDKTRFPELTVSFRIVDQHGKPAREFGEQEVVVLEHGQEVYRRLTHLKSEPMAAVLVIDTSGSMLDPADRAELIRLVRRGDALRNGEKPAWRTKMEEAKRAANRFFERLDPDTPCGLVLFNHRVWHRQPVVREKPLLNNVVQVIEVEPQSGTAIYDALDHGIDLLAESKAPGQRAVVLMTDGMDNSSRRQTIEGTVGKAKNHRIRVHAIGLGETTPTKIGDAELPADLDEKSLRGLAEQTGGRYHHVQEAEKLSEIFERVAGQLDPTFSVTFHSRRPFHDGTSRGLEIHFGNLVARTSYPTHGLITPARDPALYVGLLALLIFLLLAPSLVRRLYRFYGEMAS